MNTNSISNKHIIEGDRNTNEEEHEKRHRNHKKNWIRNGKTNRNEERFEGERKENTDNDDKSSEEQIKKNSDKENNNRRKNLKDQDTYEERFEGDMEEDKDNNDDEVSEEQFKKKRDRGNSNSRNTLKDRDRDKYDGRFNNTNSIKNERELVERSANEDENEEINGNQGKCRTNLKGKDTYERRQGSKNKNSNEYSIGRDTKNNEYNTHNSRGRETNHNQDKNITIIEIRHRIKLMMGGNGIYLKKIGMRRDSQEILGTTNIVVKKLFISR